MTFMTSAFLTWAFKYSIAFWVAMGKHIDFHLKNENTNIFLIATALSKTCEHVHWISRLISKHEINMCLTLLHRLKLPQHIDLNILNADFPRGIVLTNKNESLWHNFYLQRNRIRINNWNLFCLVRHFCWKLSK